MLPNVSKAIVALSLSASALVLSPGAATASSSRVSDPVGDVNVTSTASQRQQATVDITRVRYAVRNGRLIITTRVVDLARTAGNQFMETEVGGGGSSFTLVSTLGENPVRIATGSNLYKCKNSRTLVRYGKDLVRQVVPVKCLEAETVRLKSASVLAKNNASPIARDAARRSGTIELGATP